MSVDQQAKAARKAARDASPKIKYRCGHERALIDLTNKDCPSCREKAVQPKHARDRATRAERLNKEVPFAEAFRLPDGAAYLKTYDATAKEWTVTLAIPGVPTFTAKGSGSFRTETVIDAMYREWLAAQNGAMQ